MIEPLIARTGNLAVTNTEIARFLLSPSGLVYLVLIVLSLMLATMIEHVGVIAIAAAQLRGHGTTLSGTLTDLAVVFLRLLSFGIRSLASLVLLCAPFVVLGGIAYLLLLSRQDINYFLANRPPRWYVALGIGRSPGCGACSPAGEALCGHDLRHADPPFRRSTQDGRRSARVATRAAGAHGSRSEELYWAGRSSGCSLSVAAVWGFGRACSYLLAPAEARPIVLVPLVAGLLACQALLIAGVSFLAGGDPLPVDPPSLSRAGRNAGHVVARQTLGDRHSGHEPG